MFIEYIAAIDANLPGMQRAIEVAAVNRLVVAQCPSSKSLTRISAGVQDQGLHIAGFIPELLGFPPADVN